MAELRQAAAALGRPIKSPRRQHRWLTPKRIALFLAIDLVLGIVGWHYLTATHPTAVAAAVEGTAKDAAHNNWNAVYNSLCSSDRQQMSEPDLADAGKAAMLQIGELDHVTVTDVQPLTVPVGPLHWPATTVSGDLVPVIGRPSAYTVTVIREVGGWKMCLSVGGYSSAALGVSEPLGSGQLSLS